MGGNIRRGQRRAQIVTVAVLAAALLLVAVKRGGWKAHAAPVTPQDTVYRMLDAARDGDVPAYLRCYTGQMDSTLRQIVAEKGAPALAAYIRDFNASIKGVAIQEPQPVAGREVRLRVEFVYQDRNEAQLYYLEQAGDGWKISRLENTQGVQTPVPYGTPVE
jgi:hypothetical protein